MMLQPRCAKCNIPIVGGSFFDDQLSEMLKRGLHRCYGYDYLADNSRRARRQVPKEAVTIENCDSVIIPDIISRNTKCPKCAAVLKVVVA